MVAVLNPVLVQICTVEGVHGADLNTLKLLVEPCGGEYNLRCTQPSLTSYNLKHCRQYYTFGIPSPINYLCC